MEEVRMMDWGWQARWQEQCDVAEAIELCYGLEAAFDYVVGGGLLDMATRAARRPELARELPGFASRVRRMFTPDEIEEQLKRMERRHIERDEAPANDGGLNRETRTTVTGAHPPMSALRELLGVPALAAS